MKIYGLFSKFLYRDERSGNCAFLLSQREENGKKSSIRACGILPCLPENTPLTLEGDFEKSEQYGLQFQTKKFVIYTNNTFDAIEFCEKILNKHGGHAAAREYVRATNMSIFEKHDWKNANSEFKTIELEIQNLLQITQWIQKYPIPVFFFENLVKKYDVHKAEYLINTDPYTLGLNEGLSLEECDRIASINHLSDTSNCRIYGLHWITSRYFETKGHIYTPIRQFYTYMKKAMVNSVFKNTLPTSFLFSKKPDWICTENVDGKILIFDKELMEAEQSIARNLLRLSKSTIEPFTEQMLVNMQNNNGISYSNDQKNAIRTILKETGVSILYGGPGCGKTTTINALIKIYQKMHPGHIIKLCAPTGRAAQRMEESTNHKASTIHKLLELQPFQNICRNKENPIEAQLIIVDECSMVDTRIFALLLNAIPSDCSLILVGDPDQLESVGPGRILYDLIHAREGIFRICELKQLFRQAENSMIIQNAKMIRSGNVNLSCSSDFHILYADSPEIALTQMKKYASIFQSRDLQFLCPVKRGLAGVYQANIALQKIINKKSSQKIQFGMKNFYLNDKVLLTRNCSEFDYYNGDIGYIREFTPSGIRIECENRTILLPKEKLKDMDLAYCMTIHKSQGSGATRSLLKR